MKPLYLLFEAFINGSFFSKIRLFHKKKYLCSFVFLTKPIFFNSLFYNLKKAMKTNLISILILFFIVSKVACFGQKRAMTVDDLIKWNTIKEEKISTNGNYVSYQIQPNKGDPAVYLFDYKRNNYKKFDRAYESNLGYDANFLIYKIKVQEDTLKKKKLAKEKPDKLPKDSLGIYFFEKDSLFKIEKIKSYLLPEKSSTWFAYIYDYKEITKKDTAKLLTDTANVELKKEAKEKDKKKKKEYKQEGQRLIIFNALDFSSYVFENVENVVVSEKGERFAYIINKNDSIDTASVYLFDTKIVKSELIFQKAGKATALGIDKKGLQTTFLFSSDTIEEKRYSLIYKKIAAPIKILVDTVSSYFPKSWGASNNRTPYFSDSGNLLYFGVAEFQKPAPKDTLLDNEKVSIDIWNWKDKLLQPQQLVNLEEDKKQTFLAFYNTLTGKIIQLQDSSTNIIFNKKIDPKYYIAKSDLAYREMSSWDITDYADYYLIDAKTGFKKLIAQKQAWQVYCSPTGKYIVAWDFLEETWKLIDNESSKASYLTKNIADIFVYDEHDVPSVRSSQGFVGWSDNEEFAYINSKYDIWKFSIKGDKIPVNLTKGKGKTTNNVYRFTRLDFDAIYLPSDNWLLHFVNKITMAEGFESLNIKTLESSALLQADKLFSQPVKAEKAGKLIWTQSDFIEFPDLIMSDLDFKNAKKLSTANPQQTAINWGTISLTHWTDFKGDTLQGMLCYPENFDKTKKYPVIIYFYEKYSDRLHEYWLPAPSRSIVNFPFYTSNEYIVFVPDITYSTGLPGKDAYNSVVSGTQHISSFEYVDKSKIAIQGQSWGGYQVAYLVTQTNLYACAMGGAVVSNMTSAYGGIRWQTGMSRMFQYEQTQSRIGGTLWQMRDKYIENSPIFYADRVETPLLLMHNDADGSVPWYQGIEYFVALRRLQKPVWLLNYNGDNHNLTKFPNRVDLSIRMFQFFEHYLKDAPEPEWMKYGVPAIKKGKDLGY